ncbi:unnamed protein product [Symbiodinium microadriaticum]|nr:unnamed protein product [Symbiodinium microadriaticum]
MPPPNPLSTVEISGRVGMSWCLASHPAGGDASGILLLLMQILKLETAHGGLSPTAIGRFLACTGCYAGLLFDREAGSFDACRRGAGRRGLRHSSYQPTRQE